MANPIIPGIPEAEQELLYQKLNEYNRGRTSYKDVGAYLVALPRPDYPRYSLWIYSPLPERQSIFYIQDLSTDIHESLRANKSLSAWGVEGRKQSMLLLSPLHATGGV